jgi:hypothetical protein
MAKKKQTERVDGLSTEDLKRINKAIRQVWTWSHPWRLAKARAVGEDGFPRCENPDCESDGEPVPKVFIDHIDPVGEIGGIDYVAKLFIPSSGLQALCKKCHQKKTNLERKAAKPLRSR